MSLLHAADIVSATRNVINSGV